MGVTIGDIENAIKTRDEEIRRLCAAIENYKENYDTVFDSREKLKAEIAEKLAQLSERPLKR